MEAENNTDSVQQPFFFEQLLKQANWQLEFNIQKDEILHYSFTKNGSCEHLLLVFQFIMIGVVMNIIIIAGIFGNIISTIILSKPQMKSSTSCLLIGLSVYDTLFIVCCFLLYGLPKLFSFTDSKQAYHTRIHVPMFKIVFPTSLMCQTGSIYTTMAVTVERFIAVCHPLKARSFCTYGKAKVCLMIITTFSILYNALCLWEVHFSLSKIHLSLYCINEDYIEVLAGLFYRNWLYSVPLQIVPFMLLAALNVCIYRKIRKANAERQNLTAFQENEINLATVLMGVVVTFFVCNTFAPIVLIVNQFYRGSIATIHLINAINFLETVNSCVNFFIYVALGKKFRHSFLEFFN